MDAYDAATLLWGELEVDGQPVGERFELRAVAPNVSVEGYVESRVGEFRFPDGSTQFTAMDATGAVTGAITAAKINSNEVQRRIAGRYDSGQFVIAVNADGTLVSPAIYDFLSIPPVISTLDDPVNNVGWETSITIGTDGLPVINYLDGTADALKVTKCLKPGCN